MTNSSVEAALDSMLKAGANGVVVLVCHAYSQGILLPLATGGGALAVASTMNIVDDVIKAEAEAASIRKMPTSRSFWDFLKAFFASRNRELRRRVMGKSDVSDRNSLVAMIS
jgi:hypothetical protein